MGRQKKVLSLSAMAAVAGIVFYVLTMPRVLSIDVIPDNTADLANGETMFWAGGCASCHAAPDAEDNERLKLAGGVALDTPFGIFRVPNISPDVKHGIGTWTTLNFINAMVKGVSPDGRHYYPAFPYTNYQNMRMADLIDLKAFLDTLPAVNNEVAAHEIKFPFSIRRGLGLWKLLYLHPLSNPISSDQSAPVQRGRYLVQGPAHCGACHTPRDILGGEITDRQLAGAMSPEISDDGEPGRIPNITSHDDGIGGWTEQDIVYALESGFNPDFDSFGGSMVEVQENMARLSPDDRAAIAAYLKSIPRLPSE
ncbi:MAG: mono/diheme cytochrome c family protein [Granulosicoccus sp.]|jgi:mono/diheme cytochrome c family protein